MSLLQTINRLSPSPNPPYASYLIEERTLFFSYITNFISKLALSMKSLDTNDESFSFAYSFPSFSLSLSILLLSDLVLSPPLLSVSPVSLTVPSNLHLALGRISPLNTIRTALLVWH